MPEVLFPLDSSKPFTDQEKIGHNRWHPDIPPVATIKPGTTFRADCREWFDVPSKMMILQTIFAMLHSTKFTHSLAPSP